MQTFKWQVRPEQQYEPYLHLSNRPLHLVDCFAWWSKKKIVSIYITESTLMKTACNLVCQLFFETENVKIVIIYITIGVTIYSLYNMILYKMVKIIPRYFLFYFYLILSHTFFLVKFAGLQNLKKSKNS